MTRCKTDKQVLAEKLLANGMVLSLCDRSRKVAGDRWVVRVQGEARITVPFELYNRVNGEEPEVLAAIRERLGNELVFAVERERNFVAEEEKEAVVAALLTGIETTILDYLARPSFPQKLFRRQYEEQKRALFLARRRSGALADEDGRGNRND